MTALSDIEAFTLRDVVAEGDIREQAWYRELVFGDAEGRTVKHLPDGKAKAASAVARQVLPNDQERKPHGYMQAM